jgi:hypothetical protein
MSCIRGRFGRNIEILGYSLALILLYIMSEIKIDVFDIKKV